MDKFGDLRPTRTRRERRQQQQQQQQHQHSYSLPPRHSPPSGSLPLPPLLSSSSSSRRRRHHGSHRDGLDEAPRDSDGLVLFDRRGAMRMQQQRRRETSGAEAEAEAETEAEAEAKAAEAREERKRRRMSHPNGREEMEETAAMGVGGFRRNAGIGITRAAAEAAELATGGAEGTPLLPHPSPNQLRVIGELTYGSAIRLGSEANNEYGGGGGGGDDDDGASDGRGGGRGGGGGGGGGGESVISRATYASFMSSSRALALPGIFTNLSRCVLPSEHEVLSAGGDDVDEDDDDDDDDDDGVDGKVGSGCSSSSGGALGILSGGEFAEDDDDRREDAVASWEDMDGSDDELVGLAPEEAEGALPPMPTPTPPTRPRGGEVTIQTIASAQLTTEDMEQAFADALGNMVTSPGVAKEKAVATAVADDAGVSPDIRASALLPATIAGAAAGVRAEPDRIVSHTPNAGNRRRPKKTHSGRRHHHHGNGNHHHHRHRHKRFKRSIRRRIFLLLTEPQTSLVSAAFFIALIVTIALSNILMMLQTMDMFQFTPPDCIICGGTNEYFSANDDTNYFGPTYQNAPIPCQCPPVPNPTIVYLEDVIIWFFTVEWTLRVLCYEPPPTPSGRPTGRAALLQWLSYLAETTTVLDALAIFPYYLERYEETNGLLSLRLLRLFRVFQLVRLGQYNVTFLCLINVLVQSILSLNLLIIVLVFGAAFFGSMIYWLEKGEWKYTEVTDPPSFAYVRMGVDGVTEELSPFTSIPASFWWFMVTATTVGYGDTYPTSTGGKCVAALAMLMGVLVIAFPVSVFSDLWSKELSKAGVLREIDEKGSHGGGGTAGADDVPGKKGETSKKANCVPKEVGGPANNKRTTDSAGTKGLSKEDVNVIVKHLRLIDESQETIRNILKKSHLQD